MSGNIEENEKRDCVWNPDQRSVIEFSEGGGKLSVRDRKPSVGLLGHAAGNHHDSQSDDEGGHFAVGHESS